MRRIPEGGKEQGSRRANEQQTRRLQNRAPGEKRSRITERR